MTTIPRLPRKQIRSQLVVVDDQPKHGLHSSDHLGDAQRGNPVAVPFGQRLWRDFHKPRKGGLGTAMGVTALKTPSNHSRVLRRHLSVINQNFLSHCNVFDCNDVQNLYDKPMVYTNQLPPLPAPEGFQTFADWTRAICSSCYGAQQMFARRIGVQPQSIVSWRVHASIPKPQTLRAIADRFSIPYASLVLLANGGNTSTSPTDVKTLRTAEMLREWHNISDEDTQAFVIEQMRRLNALVAKRARPQRPAKAG